MKKIGLSVSLIIAVILTVAAQPAPAPFGALPSTRQLRWQETEMYCLIHFGMATYSDKEWGYGDEDPKRFTAASFNADQIVNAAKAGGFRGIVVVAKHHDGFCLWPSATTGHTIRKAAWKNGRGDMVKEYQLACHKAGMKMGIYCSPWDRNNSLYGKPAYVTEVYRRQLKELYAHYGELFISWHDGANGGDGYYGGSREIRKIDRSNYYGWDTTWAITRYMQPGAAIFGDIGPDVRWVGNEEGYAGETCWATYTPHAREKGQVPANGFSKYEEAITGERNGKFWMPAECDVPLRPGWFYHASQDGQTKSPHQLLDLYYKSVGRGACLDLGLSPDKRGLIPDADCRTLIAFGNLLKQTFGLNLAIGASFKTSNIRGGNKAKFGPLFLVDNDRYSYWATDDSVTHPELIMELPAVKTFNVIRLRENIKLGQRIEGLVVEAFLKGDWKEIGRATSIGANRLIRLGQEVSTNKIRLLISSPVCISLSDVGLFREPTQLSPPVIKRDKNGRVTISGITAGHTIHYTLDGSQPSEASSLYTQSFLLKEGGTITAAAFGTKVVLSDFTRKIFSMNKKGWKIYSVLPSNSEDSHIEKMLDEDTETFWSSLSSNGNLSASFPQEINIDMGNSHYIKAFTYLPRQDKQPEGIIDNYQLFISSNGNNWEEAAKGEFANIAANPLEQIIWLAHPKQVRYIKFVATHVVSGSGVAIAELGVLK